MQPSDTRGHRPCAGCLRLESEHGHGFRHFIAGAGYCDACAIETRTEYRIRRETAPRRGSHCRLISTPLPLDHV
jgi:hypothetical protein